MHQIAKRLSIYTSKGTHFFRPEEILRLEASSNYTTIYLTDQRKYITPKVLKSYVQSLESVGFIRAHRTHLINPLYIKFIHRQGVIQMIDETMIQISRRKKCTVRKSICEFY